MKNATLEENWTGKTFNLTDLVKKYGSELVIGRKEEGHERKSAANIFLVGGDVPGFIRRSISKEHATIIYNEDERRFYIKDHSKNGTRINDDPLTEITPLENGASLYFGKHEYGPVTFHEVI